MFRSILQNTRTLALVVGLALALGVASAATASSYRYSGADRYSIPAGTVSASLPTATLTDENHHILAMFSAASYLTATPSTVYWIQGGVARGYICSTNPHFLGQWVYVEVAQGVNSCSDPGYRLIVVKASITTGEQWTFQIAQCLTTGGCNCHVAAAPGPEFTTIRTVGTAIAPPGAVRIPELSSNSATLPRTPRPAASSPTTPDLVCDWDYGSWGSMRPDPTSRKP